MAWPVPPRRTGSPAPAPTAQPPADAPNVVLVVFCTARKSELGVYGGPGETTPWMAGLAAEGVRFEDAIAASSWSGGSVVSLITGAHARSFGLGAPGSGPWRLPAEAVTLAERLQRAGWRTHGVTSSPDLNRARGMAQGLEDVHEVPATGAFRTTRLWGPAVVRQGLSFLDAARDEDADRPFFLQLTLGDTHAPRRPSRASLIPFRGEGVPYALQGYRSMVRAVDEALAQLDLGLAERGFTAENTLLVVVGDHGEEIGVPEGRPKGHGRWLSPSVVQIPWLMRGPGVARGVSVAGLASGVDLTPTVLGLLGLSSTGTIGQDLSPWVTGVRSSPVPRARAFSMTRYQGTDLAAVWTTRTRCRTHLSGPAVGDGCFARQPPEQRVEDPDLHTVLQAWAAVAP